MNTRRRRWTHGGFVTTLSLALGATAIVGCASPSDTRDLQNDQPAATSSRPLFNGISLAGWDGDPRYWRVEDGLLTGETTAAAPLTRNTFLICRTAIVGDFVLEFDYVVQSDWANSGLQYRSAEWPAAQEEDRWIVGGYQADIDEPVTYTGILYGERDRGILALRGQRVEIEPGGKPKVVESFGESSALAKSVGGKGEWNRYRVEAVGNRITHSINGVRMVEATDADVVAASHDGRGARRSGVLALQLHTGQPMKIQFRNIVLESR